MVELGDIGIVETQRAVARQCDSGEISVVWIND